MSGVKNIVEGITAVAGAGLAPMTGALLMVGVLISVAPLLSTTIRMAAFVVASVISYAVTRRREALVGSRFEQHLAPGVVRRILETPGLLKLSGERREVGLLRHPCAAGRICRIGNVLISGSKRRRLLPKRKWGFAYDDAAQIQCSARRRCSVAARRARAAIEGANDWVPRRWFS